MGNILSDTDAGLLTASNCALAFIDHQPQMSFGVASGIDRQLLMNNVLMLANGAKLFGVPTILTTVETESLVVRCGLSCSTYFRPRSRLSVPG